MPIEFINLEMEEGMCTLVILGRRFLATFGCYIDVKNEKLSFYVGDDHVKFNLFETYKFPSNYDECNRIDVIKHLVKEEDK